MSPRAGQFYWPKGGQNYWPLTRTHEDPSYVLQDVRVIRRKDPDGIYPFKHRFPQFVPAAWRLLAANGVWSNQFWYRFACISSPCDVILLRQFGCASFGGGLLSCPVIVQPTCPGNPEHCAAGFGQRTNDTAALAGLCVLGFDGPTNSVPNILDPWELALVVVAQAGLKVKQPAFAGPRFQFSALHQIRWVTFTGRYPPGIDRVHQGGSRWHWQSAPCCGNHGSGL